MFSMRLLHTFAFLLIAIVAWPILASAQSVSGVRAFGGGVGPLFGLVGPGNLYLDNQGTQGYMYTPGNNFESYSFGNPTTGQYWSGAVMTLGPVICEHYSRLQSDRDWAGVSAASSRSEHPFGDPV